MAQLLYFQPDPEVPDAELLGYGDLVYSDGTTNYLAGDPEIAMGLPKPPPGVNPQGSLGMGPPAPQMPPPADIGDGLQIDATGNILSGGQPLMQQELDSGFQPVPPIDPSARPGVQPAGPNVQQGSSFRPEGTLPGLGAAPAADLGGAPPSMPAPVDIGGGMQIDATGNILQGGQPAMGGGAGGMVPVERHGALPPDVAQRQLGAFDQQQQQTIALTEQARRDESRLMAQMTLQQLAANDAQRIQREQDLAEEQAKIQRWQQEQQALVDMDIETDLRSARGDVGGVFAAIGAALLGAAGNDAGFRMIESSIDRHVRQQVARRDTKLGILAQQIGSSTQAVQLGKAALYKVAADRAEILAQKTKNDVYEAQTPAVVQQLRQKQLENLQAAEQASMGKLIERVAPPPKPPSAEALQKYGELRREREGAASMVQRVEQQLGLMWAPGKNGERGHYINKAEVLKNGVQGVGNLEQLAPDLIYSIAGQAAAEGYQVRGAVEALAYAQVRQMQPTGPISNVDQKVGQLAAAMRTEDGLLQGLERLRMGEERQQQLDAAQFGPDVVSEFNRRTGQQPAAQPAASRPATIDEMRGASSALRQQKQAPAAGESLAAQMAPEERMAQVAEDVQALAGQELPPEGIAILVAQAAHESGNGDSQGAAAGNLFGHKRTGARAGITANTTEGEGAGARRTRAEFALYPTIADGVADHLSLLQRRYPRAWEALQTGDPDAYVAALKDGGYFTGNEDQYRNAILRRL